MRLLGSKYPKNAFAAGALPRTRWELTDLPQGPLAGFVGPSRDGECEGRKGKGREERQ